MTDTAIGQSPAGAAFVSTWDASPLENFVRGALVILCFLGSPAIGMLSERGYLWLMKLTGAYTWKSTEEVVSTYEMYRKVQHGAKIFLNKNSLRGNEHDIEVLRNGHFFSDNYEKLRKDANEAENRIHGGDEVIIICPPDVSIYPAESVTEVRNLEEMLMENQKRGLNLGIEANSVSVDIDSSFARRRGIPPSNYDYLPSNGRSRNAGGSDDDEEAQHEVEKIKKKFRKYGRNMHTVTEEWEEEEGKLAIRLDEELGTMKTFLRGNFHPLFANIMYISITLAGWFMGFSLAGIDFFTWLSGATFVMAVTLFKFADYLKNWISYISILFGDMVKRGQMVTLPTTYGSLDEKTGCVLEITTSSVKVLVAKTHFPFAPQDVKWDFTLNKHIIQPSNGSGKPTNTTASKSTSTSASGLGGYLSQSFQSYGQYPQPNSFGVKPNPREQHLPSPEILEETRIAYVEKHSRVIYGIVCVPNFLFTEWTLEKPTFWRRTLQCKPLPTGSI